MFSLEVIQKQEEPQQRTCGPDPFRCGFGRGWAKGSAGPAWDRFRSYILQRTFILIIFGLSGLEEQQPALANLNKNVNLSRWNWAAGGLAERQTQRMLSLPMSLFLSEKLRLFLLSPPAKRSLCLSPPGRTGPPLAPRHTKDRRGSEPFHTHLQNPRMGLLGQLGSEPMSRAWAAFARTTDSEISRGNGWGRGG